MISIPNRVRLVIVGLVVLAVLIPCSLFYSSLHFWRFTGPMQAPSIYAKLVALANGRALLLGSDGDRKTCQLYDPDLNQWTKVGELELGLSYACRDGFCLPDGRVFICTTAYYEIYDPRSKTWIKGTSRFCDNTPILTADGHVLLVSNDGSDLVDPKTCTARPISNTESESPGVPPHAIPLLRNRALVTRYRSMLIVDTQSLQFHRCKSMPLGILKSATPLSDGRVFCVFAFDHVSEAIFDPDADQWTAVADSDIDTDECVAPLPGGPVLMVGTRSGYRALTIFEKLFSAAGGRLATEFTHLSTARIYTPATKTFVQTLAPNIARAFGSSRCSRMADFSSVAEEPKAPRQRLAKSFH